MNASLNNATFLTVWRIECHFMLSFQHKTTFRFSKYHLFLKVIKYLHIVVFLDTFKTLKWQSEITLEHASQCSSMTGLVMELLPLTTVFYPIISIYVKYQTMTQNRLNASLTSRHFGAFILLKYIIVFWCGLVCYETIQTYRNGILWCGVYGVISEYVR